MSLFPIKALGWTGDHVRRERTVTRPACMTSLNVSLVLEGNTAPENTRQPSLATAILVGGNRQSIVWGSRRALFQITRSLFKFHPGHRSHFNVAGHFKV